MSHYITGKTALHYSAENGRTTTCQLLLDHGADPNVKSKNGNLLICQFGDYQIYNVIN